MTMIGNGSKVSIHYTLTVDDEIIDSSEGHEPLEYVHGEGEIVPGLENALIGLVAGDKRQVVVAPDQGYGVANPDAVQEIDLEAFADDEGLEVGAVISVETDDGYTFDAVVTEISETTVTLDLNHPLAGKTLNFDVVIVSVG